MAPVSVLYDLVAGLQELFWGKEPKKQPTLTQHRKHQNDFSEIFLKLLSDINVKKTFVNDGKKCVVYK